MYEIWGLNQKPPESFCAKIPFECNIFWPRRSLTFYFSSLAQTYEHHFRENRAYHYDADTTYGLHARQTDEMAQKRDNNNVQSQCTMEFSHLIYKDVIIVQAFIGLNHTSF